MITINLNKEHSQIVEKYAPSLDIGGFSNLNSNDLSKASRLEYQYTGLNAELAWYLYRYGNYSKFTEVLDYKHSTCRKNNTGDGGFDDSITFNNKTRFIDIKSSHIENPDRIKYLNLIIPPREFHNNMIYVCAFTVGKDRKNVDSVILAGWEINECITEKWKYDDSKFCVPTKKLRQIKELDKFIK